MIAIKNLGYYWNRALQEVALATGARISKPTEVIILLTYRCNARCVHCYSYKVPRMEEMTTDEWFQTLEELRDWLGPIYLSITGGEALLRKDAIDIARHAAGLGFWVEFLSNGWVIDEKKAERLVASGIGRINVSLDGSSQETHDMVRGVRGFYDRSSRALENLAKFRARSGKVLQIYAKTSIMSLNVDDLKGVVQLAKTLGISGVQFQAIEAVYYSEQVGDPNWYVNNPLWVDDKDRVHRCIEELKKLKAEGYPIINSIENLSLIEAYFCNPAIHNRQIQSHDYNKKTQLCRDWAKGLQIDPAGGLRMCYWMDPFGNAKKGDIARAWNFRAACSRCGCP